MMMSKLIEKTLRLVRFELRGCWVEVRLHSDGDITGHYKAYDGMTYDNTIEGFDAKLLARRAVYTNEHVAELTKAIEDARVILRSEGSDDADTNV